MLSRLARPAVGVWLTTAIWLLVTGGMWARHDYQLKHGREISLKTAPVDPRDPLRGEFVALRYEITTAERGEGEEPGWPFRERQVVFVTLEPNGGEWRIGTVEPTPPAEGVFLRARVRSADERRLTLAYGIESFFVPEGEGRRYEEARNRDRLWAVVSVSPHGVAHLKRLEIRDP